MSSFMCKALRCCAKEGQLLLVRKIHSTLSTQTVMST